MKKQTSNLVYNGYDLKGNVIYTYKTLDEVKEQFKHESYFISHDGRFVKTYNAHFYLEEPMEEKKDALGGKDGGNYDNKGNSAHYQSQFMEYVREQERKYGTIVAYIICISQADKYAQRAGIKEGVPADKDLTKRSWYLNAAKHFKAKIDSLSGPGDLQSRNVYVNMPEEIIDVLAQELDIDNIPYVPLSVIVSK